MIYTWVAVWTTRCSRNPTPAQQIRPHGVGALLAALHHGGASTAPRATVFSGSDRVTTFSVLADSLAPRTRYVRQDALHQNFLAKHLATAVHMRFEIHSNVRTFPLEAKPVKYIALVG